MSKYDALREWFRVRARTDHVCDGCDALIEPGGYYYTERLSGGVSKPPQLRLGKLCEACYMHSPPD